jgi:hypothetical protein
MGSGNLTKNDDPWLLHPPPFNHSCAAPQSLTALSSAEGETIASCDRSLSTISALLSEDYEHLYTALNNFFQFCRSLLSTSTDVIFMDSILEYKTLSTGEFSLAPGEESSSLAVHPAQACSRLVCIIATTYL